MAYTVRQLARLAGITPRTLRYYDRIGLLRPAGHGDDNGYRYYGREELIRLQQIMFFRELRFPLERIAEILGSPGFNAREALEDQRKLLQAERKRLAELIRTIDQTINDTDMNDQDLYAGFSREEMEAYQEEARQKWGHTEAYRQSQERIKSWTKEDFAKVKEEGEDIARQIIANMDKGADSPEVQAQVTRHHAMINRFYDCPIEMYRHLPDMWERDERYAASHNAMHPRYNEILSEAIRIYCDRQA